MHKSLCAHMFSFSLSKRLRITGLCGKCMINFLGNCQFSEVLFLFYMPTSSGWEFYLFHTFHKNWWCQVFFLVILISMWSLIMVLIAFLWWLLLSNFFFFMCLAIHMLLLLSFGLFVLLLLSYNSSLYVQDTSPLSDIYYRCFLPVCLSFSSF